MSTHFTAPTWSFISPEDGDLGAIIAEMVSLVPNSSSTRSLIYGWTDPQVYGCFIDAQNRGVDSRGGVDHTQSLTPVQARNLVAFFQHIKRFDNSGDVLWWIGTSDMSDQIIHAKALWVNYSEASTLEQVPELPDYDDWREYVRTGYPVVLRGSYNWSTSAKRQVNTMDITPSPDLCDMYQRTYNRVMGYNLRKNKVWNMPTPHPTLLSPEYQKFVSDE